MDVHARFQYSYTYTESLRGCTLHCGGKVAGTNRDNKKGRISISQKQAWEINKSNKSFGKRQYFNRYKRRGMKEVKKQYDNTFRMMYVSTISISPASEVCHNRLLPSSPLLVAVWLSHCECNCCKCIQVCLLMLCMLNQKRKSSKIINK